MHIFKHLSEIILTDLSYDFVIQTNLSNIIWGNKRFAELVSRAGNM